MGAYMSCGDTATEAHEDGDAGDMRDGNTSNIWKVKDYAQRLRWTKGHEDVLTPIRCVDGYCCDEEPAMYMALGRWDGPT